MGPLGGIGLTEILIVLLLLAIVLVPVALIVWLVTVLVKRRGSWPCPRCGVRLANGLLDCPACGFDFRAIGSGGSSHSSHGETSPGRPS